MDEKESVMELNILAGGKQGSGVNKATEVLAEILAERGYFSFKYRDYGSLIEGGHSFNVLKISDEKVDSHDRMVDIILAFDRETVDKHEERLKDGGELFRMYELDGVKKDRSYNMVAVGIAAHYLGVSEEDVQKVLKDSFDEKYLEKNMEAVEKGFEASEKGEVLEELDNDVRLMSGSEAIGEGAIASGIDLYLAYPMTPATPVLHYLAAKEGEEEMMTYQLENELSVASAALGAAHTGAKTMVGSSGGGVDLMQETTSMQGISEIPMVLYLSQRAGAGSGVPTYTAQSDLEMAVKGGHGEFPRVVVAPGDARESIKATNQAFYFAENYRLLSVLLGDKHVAESDYSFESGVELEEVGRNIDTERKDGDYPNYKITDGGNSPRSVPGENVVKSSSYEHDEYGVTVEDSESVVDMTDKRMRKAEEVDRAVDSFETFKLHGNEDSDTLVVGWGSTKGAIKDAVEELGYRFLQIIYLEPFPTEIRQYLSEAEDVYLVENNATGLLGDLMKEKVCFEIDDEKKVLKYDGRPFRKDELVEKLGGGN